MEPSVEEIRVLKKAVQTVTVSEKRKILYIFLPRYNPPLNIYQDRQEIVLEWMSKNYFVVIIK